MDGIDRQTITMDVPEQAILQLENGLLGTYMKLKHLCSQEADGVYKAGWNALALAGITRNALVELQAKGLIGWMFNRNMQFIQVKA